MEEIIIDGLDEIEMQNTAVDDIDSENVTMINTMSAQYVITLQGSIESR